MLATVATYNFPYQAHLARARLESMDIPAFVADEHTINMQWLYSDALGGVRLQVPAPFAEEARQILAEDWQQPLIEQQGQEETLCPHCGSADTHYHQIGRRWTFLAFLLLGVPLYPFRSAIRCKNCGTITRHVTRSSG